MTHAVIEETWSGFARFAAEYRRIGRTPPPPGGGQAATLAGLAWQYMCAHISGHPAASSVTMSIWKHHIHVRETLTGLCPTFPPLHLIVSKRVGSTHPSALVRITCLTPLLPFQTLHMPYITHHNHHCPTTLQHWTTLATAQHHLTRCAHELAADNTVDSHNTAMACIPLSL